MCELMESSQQSHYCPHCTGEETETQTGNRRRQNLNPGSLVYCCGRWDLQGSPDLSFCRCALIEMKMTAPSKGWALEKCSWLDE